MTQVEVAPRMIRWARERSRLSVEDLVRRFPKLSAWESGKARPTLRQLEGFAHATHTPVGFLFLPEPPVEQLPIADFRTIADADLRKPSPDLLDTLYVCQQRQEWYREYATTSGESPVELVGSFAVTADVIRAAERLRRTVGFDLDERAGIPTWVEALRTLRQDVEAAGVLVMVSGIVGNNTRRRLDPREFRGFALADPLAPLVFVNGADTRAAQIFTLAHEVGHLVLGESGVSSPQPADSAADRSEGWCNAFAAEFLVPIAAVRGERRVHADLTQELNRLARVFKVSTLVMLRRIYDAGWISRDELGVAYERELQRVLAIGRRPGGGGNFYHTLPVRVSERFVRAVVTSTLEGQTLFRDAFRLLGLSKQATFEQLTHELGVT